MDKIRVQKIRCGHLSTLLHHLSKLTCQAHSKHTTNNFSGTKHDAITQNITLEIERKILWKIRSSKNIFEACNFFASSEFQRKQPFNRAQ